MMKAIHRETNKSKMDSSEELLLLQKERQNEMLREQLKSINLDKYLVSKSRKVILIMNSFLCRKLNLMKLLKLNNQFKISIPKRM